MLTKSDLEPGKIFSPKNGKIIIPPVSIKDRRKNNRFSNKLIRIVTKSYYNRVMVSFSGDEIHWMHNTQVNLAWIIENYDFYSPKPKHRRNRLLEVV